MEKSIPSEDEEIIQYLRSKKRKEEDQAMQAMYDQFFGLVQSHIIKNSGSSEDAEDIFWESLKVFWMKAQEESFELKSSVKTFFFSIAKYKWLDELRRRRGKEGKNDSLDDSYLEIPSDEDISMELIRNEKHNWLWAKINMLKEACQSLLILFYVENRSMKEIATLLGYTNSDSAKTAASKCRKKLEKLIMDDPDFPK